jgi:hypothetical protein
MKIMENKLTNEEIARVFAMYFGQKYVYKNEFGRFGERVKFDYHIHKNINQDAKLVLTPLSSITDEDAECIAHICNFNEKTLEMYKYNSFENLSDIGRRIIEYGFNTHGIFYNVNDFNYQLIIWGYSVPLYFGLNHWANGKTAIELGIATVNKQKTS